MTSADCLAVLEVNLGEAVALWSLGLLTPTQSVRLGVRLAEGGEDAREVLSLAGVLDSESADAIPAFERLMRSRGLARIDSFDAARLIARRIARGIQDASIEPYDGAKAIWRTTLVLDRKTFHELDPFIYAASEMESRPGDRAFFEDAIRMEAARWAAKPI